MITLPDGLTIADFDETETQVQQVIAALIGLLRPKLIVETDVRVGGNTVVLGLAAKEYGGTVVACESDIHMWNTARQRCRNLPVAVYNLEPHKLIEVGQADFLLFNHEYPIQEYARTKPGAVVVMNDIRTARDPDAKPLAMFVRQVGGIVLQTHRGLGILIRP